MTIIGITSKGVRNMIKIEGKLTFEGYIVLRFSENQVDNELENVISKIIGISGRPFVPVEIKPLLPVAASVIVEAGSPHPSG